MGLDMYLTKKRRDEDGHELVAYWRKANHIHGWFERNTTDGYIENCEYYPLCPGDLNCLLRDCKLALDKPLMASKVLPVQDGFFFGNFGYSSDYYRECIEQTLDVIPRILASLDDDEELFYHAWR